MKKNQFTHILKETLKCCSQDKVSTLAAALAYYTALSLAPLLIITFGILEFIFGTNYAKLRILNQMTSLLGLQATEQIKIILETTQKNPSTNILMITIGFIILLLSAMGVFGELQDGMNVIWGVRANPNKKFYAYLKDRLWSLAMILGVGFLLVVSLIFNTIISTIVDYLNRFFPGIEFLWWIGNFISSFIIVSFIFASIFKILPDVYLKWQDVFTSSIITALLFTIGKFILEFYLSISDIGSPYGAAGSLIVILVWVYYSAHILYFGAELTKVIALNKGLKIQPSRHSSYSNKNK